MAMLGMKGRVLGMVADGDSRLRALVRTGSMRNRVIVFHNVFLLLLLLVFPRASLADAALDFS